MSGVFWALFGLLVYVSGCVGLAYVAIRTRPASSGYDFPDGFVWFISLLWPVSALLIAPWIGIVLARRKQDRKRLRAKELARLEAEMFGK